MKRKQVIAAGLIALIMTGAAGCGSSQDAQQDVVPFSMEGKTDEETIPQTQADEIIKDTPETAILDSGSSQDTEIIGGKVRSVAQDSFVISRTLYDDSDASMVIMPEPGSPEEELVTVRCADTTVFELWVIHGGGAGIDTAQAAFSDIEEDSGLEAFGHFDGEEFVAEKVVIEIYK